MTRYLIAVALLTLASTAHAQTTHPIDDFSTSAAAAEGAATTFAGSGSTEDCKGRITGRWRVYFSDPVTFCTVEVRRDGTIREASAAETSCRGVFLDPSAVTGGEVDRVAPLINKHGLSNQCWIHGTIETEAGPLEILEAFIAKRNGTFTGVGIYLDGGATVVTGVRY